jgi:hypothetical protein
MKSPLGEIIDPKDKSFCRFLENCFVWYYGIYLGTQILDLQHWNVSSNSGFYKDCRRTYAGNILGLLSKSRTCWRQIFEREVHTCAKLKWASRHRRVYVHHISIVVESGNDLLLRAVDQLNPRPFRISREFEGATAHDLNDYLDSIIINKVFNAELHYSKD